MEHTKIPFYLNLPALLAAVLAWVLLGPGNAQAAEGDNLALKLRDNVVKITSEWDEGHTENGFGFIVGERGGELYIATANHVVRRAADPYAEGSGAASHVRIEYFARRGEIFEATLLATRSVDDDLAVLRASAPQGLSWQRQALSSGEAERLMPVWFVGRTGNWYVPSRPGAVNSVGLDKRIAIDDLNVQVGTSGAPLIAQSGILGMIVEEAGGIAYALPVDFIEEAFRYWNHPWQLTALSVTESRPSAAPKPKADELAPVEAAFVVLRNANVREGPNTESAVKTTLAAGTEVYVSGRTPDGRWLLVNQDEQVSGFVFAPLLQDKLAWEHAQAAAGRQAHAATQPVPAPTASAPLAPQTETPVVPTAEPPAATTAAVVVPPAPRGSDGEWHIRIRADSFEEGKHGEIDEVITVKDGRYRGELKDYYLIVDADLQFRDGQLIGTLRVDLRAPWRPFDVEMDQPLDPGIGAEKTYSALARNFRANKFLTLDVKVSLKRD